MDFNHINENNENCEELKEYYTHYHRQQWCYNRKYKQYKIISFIIDSSSAIILGISSSTAITINPLTSVISFLSLALQYIKKKLKFAEKVDRYKEVTMILNRILIDLKSNIRSEKCDIDKIKSDLTELDKKILQIIEIPDIEKLKEKYDIKRKQKKNQKISI